MKEQKSKKNAPFIILWVIFLALVFWEVAFVTTLRLLDVVTAVLSIVILAKNKMPSKKYAVISVVFAVLSVVAYLGVTADPFVLLIYSLMVGIPALLSSLAVFSVMESHGGYELVAKKEKHSLLKSITTGVLAGAVLAVVNTVIRMLGSGEEIAFDFALSKLLVCFNPGIYEEMAGRAIFMAYCVYFAGGKKMNWFQVLTMFFMMSMPHTLAHGYSFSSTVILWLLFGIPFTLLQKKKDLSSAMISHWLVDAVRFTLFGI